MPRRPLSVALDLSVRPSDVPSVIDPQQRESDQGGSDEDRSLLPPPFDDDNNELHQAVNDKQVQGRPDG
jgi:hypothetical protein